MEDPKTADDWTLIDGLQRTTCYIIAVLMAALGRGMVEMGCIDEADLEGDVQGACRGLRHE